MSDKTINGINQTSGGNGLSPKFDDRRLQSIFQSSPRSGSHENNQQRPKRRATNSINYSNGAVDDEGWELDPETGRRKNGAAAVFRGDDGDDDDEFSVKAAVGAKSSTKKGKSGLKNDGDDDVNKKSKGHKEFKNDDKQRKENIPNAKRVLKSDGGGESKNDNLSGGDYEQRKNAHGKTSKKRKGEGRLKNDDDYNPAPKKLNDDDLSDGDYGPETKKKKYNHKHHLKKDQKTYNVVGGEVAVSNPDQFCRRFNFATNCIFALWQCEDAGTRDGRGVLINRSLAQRQRCAGPKETSLHPQTMKGVVQRAQGKGFGQLVGKRARKGLNCSYHSTLTLEVEGEECQYFDVLEITNWVSLGDDLADKMKWGKRNKKSEKQKKKEAKREAKSGPTKPRKHSQRLADALLNHQFEQIGVDPRTNAKAGTVRTNKTREDGDSYYYIHKGGLFNANDKDMLGEIWVPSKKITN